MNRKYRNVPKVEKTAAQLKRESFFNALGVSDPEKVFVPVRHSKHIGSKKFEAPKEEKRAKAYASRVARRTQQRNIA